MQSLDALLARLARRQRCVSIFDALAPRLIVSATLTAVVLATIRCALPNAAWLVPAMVAAGLCAPLPWLPSAWRRRSSPACRAGTLDLLANANGLIMGFAESRDAAWQTACTTALQQVRFPPFLKEPARRRHVLHASIAVLMVGGALALPQAIVSTPDISPANALVRPLRDELAELSDKGVVTRDERQALEQRLADLVARSHGGALDQATWEGIDRVQAQMTLQATAAGEKLAAALVSAQNLAQNPANGGTAAGANHPGATPNAADDSAAANALAAQLAVDLARLAEQAPGLLPPHLNDAQQRAALAAALDRARAKGLLSTAQIEALKKAGLTPGINPPGGAASAAASRQLAQQLAKELAKRANSLTGRARSATELLLARLAAGQGSCPGGPGSGTPDSGSSPSRGPGEAALDHLTRARTAGGDQAPLIPGATLNADGSVTVAATAREAQLDDAARAALQRAAARDFDATAADSRRAAVAPRHRAVVETFFSDDDNARKP